MSTGLSPQQQGKYRPVVDAAWTRHCQVWSSPAGDKAARRAWYERELFAAAGVHSTTGRTWTPDAFHDLLLHFATLAQDVQLVGHLAVEDERRLRWLIERALDELSFIECHTVDWPYARAIFEHMRLPLTIEETPLEYLHKVFQALDTHVRRQLLARNKRLGQCMTRTELRAAIKHQAALEAAYT